MDRVPDAVMNQYLHAIGPFVGKHIRMMRMRSAKDPHNPCQGRIGTGPHIQGLNGHPDLVDTDHAINSRSTCASAWLLEDGQCRVMFNRGAVSSTRTVASAVGMRW